MHWPQRWLSFLPLSPPHTAGDVEKAHRLDSAATWTKKLALSTATEIKTQERTK